MGNLLLGWMNVTGHAYRELWIYIEAQGQAYTSNAGTITTEQGQTFIGGLKCVDLHQISTC